jgi:hypothetical protein
LDVECLGGKTYQDKGNITLIRWWIITR